MATQTSPLSIRWAHATNSKKQLLDALYSDEVDFIEADVLRGRIRGGSKDGTTIMAHPPDRTSDLTFKDWIQIVADSKTTKGIKLDFKEFDTVESCLSDVIEAFSLPLSTEIWLNADILEGPNWPSVEPLSAEGFIALCTAKAPKGHTLSLGWTTGPPTRNSDRLSRGHLGYTWNNVLEMARVVEKAVPAGIAVTYPVRLSYVSFSPLAHLLLNDRAAGRRLTLTIWSHLNDDPLQYGELALLMRALPRGIYADLPADQSTAVQKLVENLDKIQPPAKMNVTRWTTASEAQSADCQRVWASPYAVVVSGPGTLLVEIEEPSRLRWRTISGDLSVAGPVARLNSSDHLYSEEDQPIPGYTSKQPTQTDVIFVGTGEAVLYVRQYPPETI